MIRGLLGALLRSDPAEPAADRPRRPVGPDAARRRAVERYHCAEHDVTLALVAVCPACGVDRPLHQPVVEHPTCGCIRPLSEFRAGRRYRCPGCSAGLGRGDLDAVAELDTCGACGANSDASAFRLRRADERDTGDGAVAFRRVTSSVADRRRSLRRGADITFDRLTPAVES